MDPRIRIHRKTSWIRNTASQCTRTYKVFTHAHWLSSDVDLITQGFWTKSSWGFPKGKVNEEEPPHICAARYTYSSSFSYFYMFSVLFFGCVGYSQCSGSASASFWEVGSRSLSREKPDPVLDLYVSVKPDPDPYPHQKENQNQDSHQCDEVPYGRGLTFELLRLTMEPWRLTLEP
jgi:hypothetical protein